MKAFDQEVLDRIESNGRNPVLKCSAGTFMKASLASRYSYNFSWLGRPIIQYPQDILVMQELIWSIQPDLIVETGIAHGGSLVFFGVNARIERGLRRSCGSRSSRRRHRHTKPQQTCDRISTRCSNVSQ